MVLPLKAATVGREAMRQLEDLPGWAHTVIGDLLSEVHRLDERIAQYDRHIEQIVKESAPARQLMQLPGIGATTATALVVAIPAKNARMCWAALHRGEGFRLPA